MKYSNMAVYRIAVLFILLVKTSNAVTTTLPVDGEIGSGDIDNTDLLNDNFTQNNSSTEQSGAMITTSIQQELFSYQPMEQTTHQSSSVKELEDKLTSLVTSSYLRVEDSETTSVVTPDRESTSNTRKITTLTPYLSTTKQSTTASPSTASTQSTVPSVTTTLNTETTVTRTPTIYIHTTSLSVESTISESETTTSSSVQNTVTDWISNYTTGSVSSTENISENRTWDFDNSTITTFKPSEIPQTISISTITTGKMTNVSHNTELGTDEDYLLLHLAYILPCVFIILLAVIISGIFLYRFKQRKREEDDTEGGYVLKRQKKISNPAFMEQNMNALAYQLQSRDSMVPSAFKTKLRYQGNSFEEIDLSEEDQITEQNTNKNQTRLVMETNFSPINETNSPFTTLIKQDQKQTTEEDIPPLPAKCQKVQSITNDTSASHYDVLPLRESLPIKQRKNSSINEMPGLSTYSSKNPEYDVLPLKTFTKKQLPTDSKEREFSETTKQDTNIAESFSVESDVKLSEETSNLPDEVFRDDNTASGSKSENEAEQGITDLNMIENEAVGKLRHREPAARAPSFVVLPRAASGSLRTAL